jgi:hypothetical protein
MGSSLSSLGSFAASLANCGAAQEPEPVSVAATPAAALHLGPLLAGPGRPGLPSDVLPHIGKFLSIEDLGRLAGTSQRLRQHAAAAVPATHLNARYRATLPMKRAVFECFNGLAPESHFLSSGFTAACGPLLGFLHPSQRARLVEEALEAHPPTNHHAIAGLLAGISHLSDAERERLLGAVRAHKVVAGIQHWDGDEIRRTADRAIGRGLAPGSSIRTADIAALGGTLGSLTEIEVSGLIRDAVDIAHPQLRYAAVAALCSGLKLLQAPQPADLARLFTCLNEPEFAMSQRAKTTAVAGLGEVMRSLTESQRNQLLQLAIHPDISRCVAMAGIGRGIAHLQASEAAPHVERALGFVANYLPGPFAVHGDDIAVAIAGIGEAAEHMTTGQRGALLAAALQCSPSTVGVALAGLCAGIHAMNEGERAHLVAAVLNCPAQTRAVAIAGLGPELTYLDQAQSEALLAAAIATATETFDADDDALISALTGHSPAIDGISALAGVAAGMETLLTQLAQARQDT